LSESGFTGFKDKKDYGLSWVAATPVASSGPAFETVIVNVVVDISLVLIRFRKGIWPRK